MRRKMRHGKQDTGCSSRLQSSPSLIRGRKTVVNHGRRYFPDTSARFTSVKMSPRVQRSTRCMLTATPATSSTSAVRSGIPLPLVRPNELIANGWESKNWIRTSYNCALSGSVPVTKEEHVIANVESARAPLAFSQNTVFPKKRPLVHFTVLHTTCPSEYATDQTCKNAVFPPQHSTVD